MLKSAAQDERWRIREAVAMAIQELVDIWPGTMPHSRHGCMKIRTLFNLLASRFKKDAHLLTKRCAFNYQKMRIFWLKSPICLGLRRYLFSSARRGFLPLQGSIIGRRLAAMCSLPVRAHTLIEPPRFDACSRFLLLPCVSSSISPAVHANRCCSHLSRQQAQFQVLKLKSSYNCGSEMKLWRCP